MTDLAFPDHEYLTVKELADLLRLKERKIYDLAASGAVPCSRATGKLLFPAADIREWIAQAKSGGHAGAPMVQADRPAILLGSHDPLLDWAVRQSRCGLATYFDGSFDGLDRFVKGEGVAAGLHIHDAPTQEWNVPAVSRVAAGQNAVLVGFAQRRRGLVLGASASSVAGLSDLPGRCIAPRQPESGSDVLFQELIAGEGLDSAQLTFAEVARTEDDAVEMIRRGEADVTFGLEAVARAYGLGFVPVIEESFALLVDRKAWFDPQVSALVAFCGTQAFRQRAEACGGYDVAGFGEVLWNA